MYNVILPTRVAVARNLSSKNQYNYHKIPKISPPPPKKKKNSNTKILPILNLTPCFICWENSRQTPGLHCFLNLLKRR